MTRMTPARYLVLIALAVAASVFFLMGLPDALEASRRAQAGGPPAQASQWSTVALAFGFPAWLWAVVLAAKAKEWRWVAIVTLGSYIGVVIYAVRGLRAQRSVPLTGRTA